MQEVKFNLATKMRLTRMGKKKQPFYRIVVTEDDSPRDSRYIDLIGWYNPMKENKVSIDESKALKWLRTGAKPTDTVRNLLSTSGLLKKFAESKSNSKSSD